MVREQVRGAARLPTTHLVPIALKEHNITGCNTSTKPLVSVPLLLTSNEDLDDEEDQKREKRYKVKPKYRDQLPRAPSYQSWFTIVGSHNISQKSMSHVKISSGTYYTEDKVGMTAPQLTLLSSQITDSC